MENNGIAIYNSIENMKVEDSCNGKYKTSLKENRNRELYYSHRLANIIRMLILPQCDPQNAYSPSRLFIEVHNLTLNLQEMHLRATGINLKIRLEALH